MKHFIFAFLFCLLPFASRAVSGETMKEVVVTGIGKTEDAANRQAFRNAVDQAVGSVVTAETLVENDALIRDRIVAYSDGYISKVERLGPARSVGDGLIEVRIRAVVAMGKLTEKLKSENITLTQMDGESLFAGVVTKREKASNLGDSIEEALSGMPAAVLKATAGKPVADEKDGSVKIPVTVKIDYQKYGAFCRQFTERMAALGVHGQNKLSALDDMNVAPYDLLWNNSPGSITIALCEQINRKAKQSRWKVFYINETAFQGFVRAVKWTSVRVDILDANGQVITSSAFPLYQKNIDKSRVKPGQDGASDIGYPIFSWQTNKGSSTGGIVPTLYFASVMNTAAGWFNLSRNKDTPDTRTVTLSTILSDEELRQATSIKCTVFTEE